MKHIKSTETIGKELGYSDPERQYAAVTGCLSAKVQLIANEIERLREGIEEGGAFVEDYERTIRNIEMILENVIE